jgi:hypothetical protein
VQDRYADDVGQFMKVALMRWLVSPSPYGRGYQLGMIWLQEPGTRDEADGDPVAYLHSTHDADEDLRSLDPDLYDRLRSMAAQAGGPLSVRDTCRVLPADTVLFDQPLRFDDLVRDDRAARAVCRQRWFHEAMVAVASSSLVFLDSDNGLDRDDPHVASRDNVSSGVWMSEVGRLLERGQSVVTHQFADPSSDPTEFASAHMRDIHEALDVEPLAMAQQSNGRVRLFSVIPHDRHRSDLQDRIGALQLSRWGDEFRVHRWRSAPVTI